jgi:hypothetical protein
MFGFGKRKSKQANVLSHWYTPVPNFTLSTQEFYTKVEKELTEQKVPDLEISRVEFAEGGLFSAKRQYLRLTRERLVFDICAAPFGVNYFFSCRFAELPEANPAKMLLSLGLNLLLQRLNLRLLEPYYKEDTRLMYLTVVEGVVKKLVEQETAAKGITLLQEYEHVPILGDLYKLNTKTLEQKTVSPK